MKVSCLLAAGAGVLLGVTGVVRAAEITWGPPANSTGPADVLGPDTSWCFFDSASFFDTDLTINGVLFNGLLGSYDSGGKRIFSFRNSSQIVTHTDTNNNPPRWFADAPTNDYQRLLYKSAYSDNTSSNTVTLNGLTVGRTYRLQIWTPEWNSDFYTAAYGDAHGHWVQLLLGKRSTFPFPPPDFPDRLAQHVVGTFVADATSQTILMSGSLYEFAPAVSIFEMIEAEEPPPDTWKWVQYPDLSDLGMDVEAMGTNPYLLADDFLCAAPSTITNIVVWGSWYHDILPQGNPNDVTFYLSFHSDVPAGVNAPWSMPGQTLWWTNFPPGTFTATPISQGQLHEGWYNPATSNWVPNADYTCWRYEFPIAPSQAFAQTGTVYNPIVYWLSVQAMPMGVSAAKFGWKTSTNHWNDAAASAPALEPYNGYWWEMCYPSSHPYGLPLPGQPIDLAFALFGGSLEEPSPDYDFGDAPLPYPTLVASNGAVHVLNPTGPWLGGPIDDPDSEPDGQPDANALGDDNAGSDDENGVVFPTLVVGLGANIVYEVRGVVGSANISCHIDWNADGDWDDTGEQWAFWNTVYSDGVYTNTLWYIGGSVPLDATPGTTFARVRVSTTGWQGPVGMALDGEVEDYAVTIEKRFDYGDAPLPYPTLAASNAAVHIAVGPWLGNASDAPDCENDGQPDANALGDDTAAPDDENGIVFPTLVVGLGADIVYEVRGVAGTAYISGHIDWNADGDWDDPGETYAFWNVVSADGIYTNMIAVPLSAARGKTFARVRVGNSYIGPTGLLYDGEVEDHAIIVEERFDYGDAPLPYPSRAANNGAVHIAVGPWLGGVGDAPDLESDGQPDANALGDDTGAMDDESGVVFPGTLVAGTTTNIDFLVSSAVGNAYVEIWIDWNGDGDWTTPGDWVWASWHADGLNTISLSVPQTLVWGNSFARVRISELGTGAPTGLALSGEVEDYQVRMAGIDYGDAPESGTAFATTLTKDGARHLQRGLLWMWPSVDSDFNGQPTSMADGDDNAGADDEDGVALPAFVRQDRAETVTVNATASCKLNAWIDFNADGDWLDAGEQIFIDTPLVAGVNTLSFNVPPDAVVAMTYARFRVSSAGGDGPSGLADDGEVEDYTLEIFEKFPQAMSLKWRQPLDSPFGMSLQSWTTPNPWDERFSLGPVVADNWWCDGRPINAIRWWGAYIQYSGPSNTLQVVRPSGFRLNWYLDRPTNTLAGAFSRPVFLIKQTTVTLAPYLQRLENLDEVTEAYVSTVPLDFLGPAFAGQSEHKFEYNVVLSEPWLENNTFSRDHYTPPCSSNVYWLAIEAFYDTMPLSAVNTWGWETTAQRFNWNAAAVIMTNELTGATPWSNMVYVPQVEPWRNAVWHPYTNKPVNMAFEMLSDVVGRRATKWAQLPNMELGTDMPSWRYDNPAVPPVGWATNQTLRADDFVSDGRRITDIHWWGSYIGLRNSERDGEFGPGPLPQGVDRPLGFDLSWHAHDIAANAPGNVITNIFVPIDRCHEVYYCTIPQTGPPAYEYEHEYKYFVDLKDERLGLGTWYVQQGVHYWLNVQAVFDNTFIPARPGEAGMDYPHEGWGWTFSGIESNLMLERSVVSNYVTSVAWNDSTLPAWYGTAGTLHDLAFELKTDQTETNASITITSFQLRTNMVVEALSRGTGNAGVQVLQRCSTLQGTPLWTDVETNEVPFPLPADNTWQRENATSSGEFYRVIERNPVP